MAGTRSLSGAPLYPEQTTPATPPAGFVAGPYAKSDKHLYQLDSSGLETDLAAAAGGGVPVTVSADYTMTVNTQAFARLMLIDASHSVLIPADAELVFA